MKNIILICILFMCTNAILLNAQVFNLGLERSSLDCNATQVCYNVQMTSTGGDFAFGDLTLRMVFDGDIISFVSYTSLLPVSVYTGNVASGNGVEFDATGQGSLDFDDNLGFINASILLNNPSTTPLASAQTISSTPTNIGELCFDLDVISGTDCIDLVFVDQQIDNDYNLALNILTEYLGPNMTSGIPPGTFDNLDDSDTDAACLFDSECALPVEFTHFSGKTINCQTELAWTTASELNNDRFEVEHSNNAKDFEGIAKVKGAGTTLEVQNYQFIHEGVELGDNYYRIKQIDTDGTFDYSETIVVKNYCKLGEDVLSIFPNPVGRQSLNIRYTAQLEHKAEIELMDALGQRLLRQPIEVKNGENSYQLDIEVLPAGSYYLVLYKEDGTIQRKQFTKIEE